MHLLLYSSMRTRVSRWSGILLLVTTLTCALLLAVLLTLPAHGDEPGQGGGGPAAIGPVGRDFTGDGAVDFLVPRPLTSVGTPVSGYVRVYSGDTRELAYTLVSGEVNDHFGVVVDSAGDLNGDGHDDVIVAAPRSNRGGFLAGAVYLFSGATGELLQQVHGQDYQRLGRAVAGMGDLDGDGISDFAAAGFVEDQAGSLIGAVHIFSGADPDVVLATITGPPGEPSFGEWLCAPGDLNGNGAVDLVVAAPGAEIAEGVSGVVYVFYGDPAASSMHQSKSVDDANAIILNDLPGVYDFGRIMMAGKPVGGGCELIVGSAFDVELGRIRSVFRSFDGSTLQLLEVSDPAPLMYVGDVNADLVIDGVDLDEVLIHFLGEPDPESPHNPDADGDGIVTAADLALVVIGFGQEHPLLEMTTDAGLTASVLSSRAPDAVVSTHCFGPTHYIPAPEPYPTLSFGDIEFGCCLETSDPFSLPIDHVGGWVEDCIDWPEVPEEPTSEFTPEQESGVIDDGYGGSEGPGPETYPPNVDNKPKDDSGGGGGPGQGGGGAPIDPVSQFGLPLPNQDASKSRQNEELLRHGPNEMTCNPVLIADGVKLEREGDLHVTLPGRDFNLVRVYNAGAASQRPNFPWMIGHGWGASVDGWARFYPERYTDEIVTVKDPDSVNPVGAKVEIVRYPLEDGSVFYSAEQFLGARFILPSPSTASVTQESLHVRNEALPVWRYEKAGSGQTDFFRTFGHPDLDILNGRILQERDVFGNKWTYEYASYEGTGAASRHPRLRRVFLNGESEQDCDAII